MNLTLIAAVDRAFGIGYQEQLPWHLPADMTFFRKNTIGHPVLMGRKTYESIGKPLKDRDNYILTRQPIQISDAHIIHQLEDIAHLCDEIMVIGGAQIYNLCLPFAKRILLTEVDTTVKSDTFFPRFNHLKFKCVSSQYYPADENNIYNMWFKEYQINQ